MRYAVSIAIVFMLPSARSGALEWLPRDPPGSLSSAPFRQSSADEKQLLMIQQQLARAWVERDRAFIERVLAPEWSVTRLTAQFGHALPSSTTPLWSKPCWLRA
jgi:hypothetical protein